MFEPVHTLTDYYDGPRQGVADFDGVPHLYVSTWADLGDPERVDEYLLCPLTHDELALLLEDWEIWRRWERAFAAGETSIETHPALPPDRSRQEQLERALIARGLASDEGNQEFLQRLDRAPERARARFCPSGGDNGHASLVVEWTVTAGCEREHIGTSAVTSSSRRGR